MHKVINPSKIAKVSFQNLDLAKKILIEEFDIDMSSCISSDEWEITKRQFQKRHIVSHKMGVVDNEYVQKTGDMDEIVGRKVRILSSDVEKTAMLCLTTGKYIATQLALK